MLGAVKRAMKSVPTLVSLKRRVLGRGVDVVSFAAAGRSRGRILVSHRIDGVRLPAGHPRLREHNQFAEVVAIVETMVERGYDVDVLSHRHLGPPRRGDYDLFLGVRANFDHVTQGLDPSCIRVLHVDTTHWLFNNHASLGRSLEVQLSRGVTPERDIEIERNDAIEAAHYAVAPGNEFVYETFAYAGKPMFEIVNPAITVRSRPIGKDFAAIRRNFLWLGSRGLAHKGLGRVLEAFAELPEHNLTVCGPLAEEPRFCEAYRRELTELPNVRVLGWVDVTGPEFAEIARTSLAHVLPSCAEAQAGASINCMAAGLIPMVSRQVALNVTPDFGVMLEDDSVEGVRRAVRALSTRPPDQLAGMSQRAWDTARTRHSLDSYKLVLGDVLERILAEHPRLGAVGFVRLGEAEAVEPARRATMTGRAR